MKKKAVLMVQSVTRNPMKSVLLMRKNRKRFFLIRFVGNVPVLNVGGSTGSLDNSVLLTEAGQSALPASSPQRQGSSEYSDSTHADSGLQRSGSSISGAQVISLADGGQFIGSGTFMFAAPNFAPAAAHDSLFVMAGPKCCSE